MEITAIGMVEFNSIAQGIESTDAMCKIADVYAACLQDSLSG